MSIHAHPDDEASKGAPTIARYASEGHQTYLVCCTGGEEGDVINKAMDRPEIHENLDQVRVAELERSVKIIGFSELDWLGYRDSGMAESESNNHPDCFAMADMDEAAGRLVELIRRYRPHVIITYSDDQQGYRHPDHLQVHDVTVPAFDRAGDPSWYPELGQPWQPLKLYYSLWSRARMEAHHELYGRLGLKSPYPEDWFERRYADDRITTKIDVSEFYGVRRKALLAHETQIDPEESFWFGLPDDLAVDAYPYDDYILAKSLVRSEQPEGDLLAGLDDLLANESADAEVAG